MNYGFQKNKKAFSLIELLIVIAIMLIMTGTLFVNNREKKIAADVESVVRQVAAEIRGLQNESLTGKQIGTDYVGRYRFEINLQGTNHNADSATISYRKLSGVAPDLDSRNIDLSKKKVEFYSSADDDTDFYFESPRGEITWNDNNKVIKLRSTVDTNVTRLVCISDTGSITEEKTICP